MMLARWAVKQTKEWDGGMGVVRLKNKLQEGYESKLREYASWKKSAKGYEPSKPCVELLEDIHLYQVPFTVFFQLPKKKERKREK